MDLINSTPPDRVSLERTFMLKMILVTPKEWWKERLGMTTRARIDTKKNQLRIYTGENNMVTGILRISPSRRLYHRFDLHYTIYYGGMVVNIEIMLTRAQLAALGRCSLPGLPPFRNDEKFAQKYGATVAVRGKFIAADKKVNVPGPGRNENGDTTFSFLLTPYIMDKIALLVRYDNVVKPLNAK